MNQTFQWPYTLSPYDSGLVIEDVWPTIFFGAERLKEIRRKTDALQWIADSLSQMREEAEIVLKEPPQLPEERIGWRHDFYSHTTAEHLIYDPQSPHRFLDPADQSLHESEVQHRAWTLLTHERTYRLMRSLGLLYGLTGDERYASWIAEGMRLAAQFFTREDLREGNHGDALYFQPLYDAQVLALLMLTPGRAIAGRIPAPTIKPSAKGSLKPECLRRSNSSNVQARTT